jgi:hypothetical protein
MIRIRSGAFILFVSLWAAHGAADMKGSFRYGSVHFEPVDSFAFQMLVLSEDAPVTTIALTSFKIDREAVMAAINPLNSLYSQAEVQTGNLVVLQILRPDRCEASAFLVGGERPLALGFGSFQAKTLTSTASRIAGKCFTPKPEKRLDKEVEIQLSYDLPIAVIPKPVPLPDGGGEPGLQYMALIKAIQASDWDGAHLHIREGELPETRKEASESNYFENLSLNYPKSATVTGGLIKGSKAQLNVRGINHDGRNIKGSVALKKVGDAWRVVDQQFFGRD